MSEKRRPTDWKMEENKGGAIISWESQSKNKVIGQLRHFKQLHHVWLFHSSAYAAFTNSIDLSLEGPFVGDASPSHGRYPCCLPVAIDRLSLRDWALRTRYRHWIPLRGAMMAYWWYRTGRTAWPRAGLPSHRTGWKMCPSHIPTMTWALPSCTSPPTPMK